MQNNNNNNQLASPVILDASTKNLLTTFYHRFLAGVLYCGLVCPPVDPEFFNLVDYIDKNEKGACMLLALFASGCLSSYFLTDPGLKFGYSTYMFMSRPTYWVSSVLFEALNIAPLQASKSNMPVIIACLVMSSMYMRFSTFSGRFGSDYDAYNLKHKHILMNLLGWKAFQMVVSYISMDKFWNQAFHCIRNDLSVMNASDTPLCSHEFQGGDNSRECSMGDDLRDHTFDHCFNGSFAQNHML
ncbi:MAG: hypothetical protein VXZ73_02345 [Pseudomonadota bacterium]|nr:hypothetical protein [Pseudomonadota bacterium]MEC8977413.1 hypothetical protein [Pseudomonadota bacterium]